MIACWYACCSYAIMINHVTCITSLMHALKKPSNTWWLVRAIQLFKQDHRNLYGPDCTTLSQENPQTKLAHTIWSLFQWLGSFSGFFQIESFDRMFFWPSQAKDSIILNQLLVICTDLAALVFCSNTLSLVCNIFLYSPHTQLIST